MIKICFLIVVLIIHALNILLECIKNTFFKIGEQLKVVFSNSLHRKMIDCIITVKHLWKSLLFEDWAL